MAAPLFPTLSGTYLLLARKPTRPTVGSAMKLDALKVGTSSEQIDQLVPTSKYGTRVVPDYSIILQAQPVYRKSARNYSSTKYAAAGRRWNKYKFVNTNKVGTRVRNIFLIYAKIRLILLRPR